MMTPVKFPLYLSCLCLCRIALTSDFKSVRQEGGFRSANVGDNVTLRCFFGGDVAAVFYWYKQTLGQKPHLMSTFYKHDKSGSFAKEFMNDQRLKLETNQGKYHLTISNLSTSDSATYYCLGCYAYTFEFAEGITVSVKGSGVNIPALVHQSTSQSIQPGGSITLNCTVHTGSCDGEHTVYWFKQSEESHPGLIYTHGGRNDQCERKANTQTHTCVYNLPLESLKRSHAGTYYCAVASCGHILFGDKIELDFERQVNSPDTLVYILSGALAFTTLLVVIMARAVYKMKNRNKCTADSQRDSASTTTNAEGDLDADNLHYAALRVNNANRSRRQSDNIRRDCVYSSVKH